MSIRVKYITCKWISYRSQGEWLWGASRGTKIRERLSGSEPTSRQIAVSDNWMLMSQIIHLICIIYIYHIVIPFSMLDCGLVQCWRQALRSSGVFFFTTFGLDLWDFSWEPKELNVTSCDQLQIAGDHTANQTFFLLTLKRLQTLLGRRKEMHTKHKRLEKTQLHLPFSSFSHFQPNSKL